MIDAKKKAGEKKSDESLAGYIVMWLFFICWLVGWVFGEKSAIEEIIRLSGGEPGNLGIIVFIVFWLVGWTIGGIAACGFLFYEITKFVKSIKSKGSKTAC